LKQKTTTGHNSWDFPLNILFAGIRNDGQTGQQSLVDVCYEPAPETFREGSQRKEMCYFTKPKNGYFIRVIFEKATSGWQTEKFKGKKLIRSAFGSTFEQAMIHRRWTGRSWMSAEPLSTAGNGATGLRDTCWARFESEPLECN
jgi:hypothetical protein